MGKGMGCGPSTANVGQVKEGGKSPSIKKIESTKRVNEMGGHAYNLQKDSLEGVLTLHIGKTFDLGPQTLKSVTGKNVYIFVTFGAQTFKSGWLKGADTNTWDDICHIWVQDHQLDAKVLISLYEGSRLVCMNYVLVKDLMAEPDAAKRSDCTLGCSMFPEAVFRGNVYSEDESLGKFSLQATYRKRREMTDAFWHTMFLSVDYNGDGVLDVDEFKDLVQIVTDGNEKFKKAHPNFDINELFKAADENQDNRLSVSEVAGLVNKDINLVENSTLYSHLVEQYFHQDRGKAMKGGYMSRDHAAKGWGSQASEWLGMKEYSVGMNVGAAACAVLVWDRENGCVIEEKISPSINMAMRSMYQTVAGRTMLMLPSTTTLMKEGTQVAGQHEDDPKSIKKIPGFIKAMAINVTEIRDPLESFKTYNEFFMRKLKPEARPVHDPNNPRSAVQPADSRCNVFEDIESCTKLWVKGKAFTMAKLLNDDQEMAKHFEGGSIVIARLAPQDYHRFHAPVDGKVVSISPVVGKQYWTVNPVAINSPVNVFGENVRRIALLESEQFGKVAYISVGATMVASIVYTGMEEGKSFARGDDLGTFKFGGSTVILLFQKGAIKFDKILLDNSKKSMETLVKMGQSMGTCTR